MPSNSLVFLLRKSIALALSLSVLYLSFIGILFDFSILILIATIIVVIIPGKNPRLFLADWSLFGLGIFFHTLVRGFADDMKFPIIVEPLLNIERWLFFSSIPTVWLQDIWHNSVTVHWHESVLALFYVSFFIFPFIVAYVLWLKSRRQYYQFALAFTLLNVVSLFIFVFLPTAPPWYAAEQGFFELQRLTADAIKSFYYVDQHNFLLINRIFLTPEIANHVAAFPSLHSAWAFLASLFSVHFFGKKFMFLHIIPIGIWLSVVYFGEHYVVDVLAGIGLAWGAYKFVLHLEKRREIKLSTARQTWVIPTFPPSAKKVKL